MTLSINVVDASGKKAGSVELPAEIFDVQVNIPLIHQVVVAQRAAARQGTHKAKNRGEVSGGGKKPFAQKGTGRARQGSTRSPNQRHGGVAHGPVPRSYAQRTPKKMIAGALRGTLSDRARNGRIHVISEVLAGDPSTKAALAAVAQFSDRKHLLVVLSRNEESAWFQINSTHTTLSSAMMWSSPRVPSKSSLPVQSVARAQPQLVAPRVKRCQHERLPRRPDRSCRI